MGNLSIKTKFMVIIIFTIVFSMFFSYVISTEVIYRNMKKRFSNSIIEKTKIIEKYIENIQMNLERESEYIASDYYMLEFLKNVYQERKEEQIEERQEYIKLYNMQSNRSKYYKMLEEYKKIVKKYLKGNELEINIIDIEGNYIYDNSRYFFEESLPKKIDLNDIVGEKNSKTVYDIDGNENYYFKVYTPILNEGKPYGILLFTYKITMELSKEIDDVFGVKTIVLDSEKRIVKKLSNLGTKFNLEKMQNSLEIKGEIFELEFLEIKDSEENILGYFAIAFSTKEIIESIKEVSGYLFIGLLIIFGLIFMISNSIINILIDSMKELTLKINSLRGGNFKVNLTRLKKRNDEIGILAQDFEQMVMMLKNKIDELEAVSKNNIEYSEKLEIANVEMEKAKKDLENKNKSIDMINKMLSNRIAEITNLYHLIINISKYITDERFYNFAVRGLREGLQIKKVVLMEKKGDMLYIKAKQGINHVVLDVKIDEELEKKLKSKDILEYKELKIFDDYQNYIKPYIIPLVSERKELYGIIIADDGTIFDKELIKSITTYIKTIVLAFENRNLYLRLLEEIGKLEKTTEQLQKSENLKNIFLANVSHELKMPLVPIKGYTEMMLNGKLGDINVIQRKGLLSSLNNVERLQEIIENILIYLRIEEKNYELVNRNFNLTKIIDKAIMHRENIAQNKNIKILKEIEDYSIEAYGDEDALTQVFINIISNGIKFSKIDGKVIVRVKEKEEKYEVEIEDNGVGMDKTKVEAVFESFKQLQEGDRRQYNGLGLGLTVAKNILDYYDEGIYIESELEKGTKVKFYIPKKREKRNEVL